MKKLLKRLEEKRIEFRKLDKADQNKIFDFERVLSVRFDSDTFEKDGDALEVEFAPKSSGPISFTDKDLKRLAAWKIEKFQIDPKRGSITVRWS
jgi:hypothetical protein